jgi:hypothetical protein
MEKILDSKITVPKIEIKVDEKSDPNVQRFINEWGRSIPIIQINDYVLNTGDLISLEINVSFNSLVKFNFDVNDEDFHIREALSKTQIDTCIIFIGYKEWHIKFKGLILNCVSDIGSPIMMCNGIIDFKDLYTIEQKYYKDKSIKEILTEILKDCNLGLCVFDNPYLNTKIDSYINPHIQRLEVIENLIKTKSRDNIYCFDTFGYLHIGNIDAIRKEKVSKYTLRPETGDQINPSDMILTSIKRNEGDKKETYEKDYKIPIDYYTINTNLTELIPNNVKKYSVVFENGKEDAIEHECEICLDFDDRANMFSGFNNNDFPFYVDLVNKSMKGNSISITMKNILFELLPFDVVNFECFLAETKDKPQRLDVEHSGNKIVIGYTILFEKPSGDDVNMLKQIIELI